MWVFGGGLPDKPVILFKYSETRSAEVAQGGPWQGTPAIVKRMASRAMIPLRFQIPASLWWLFFPRTPKLCEDYRCARKSGKE